MFGRLVVQGPKRGGRPATSWADCLQKNLEAFGAVPRKHKGPKWIAFGVVVKDGRDSMTAANNVEMWHRAVEWGAEHSITPGVVRTFANSTCGVSARLMNLYSSYVCYSVLFCLFAVVSISCDIS